MSLSLRRIWPKRLQRANRICNDSGFSWQILWSDLFVIYTLILSFDQHTVETQLPLFYICVRVCFMRKCTGSHSLTHPVVRLTFGASRLIGQALFSIPLCSQPFEGLHPILILSILIWLYVISRLFFCLPFLLPPCTVPCRIIFASPVDLVMCPYWIPASKLTD